VKKVTKSKKSKKSFQFDQHREIICKTTIKLADMKISVCIIEDDLNFSRILRSALSHTPLIEISAVADELAIARERLSHTQDDVYLVDLNLPDGCGVEFIEEVHKRYPNIKLLALSSLGDQKNIVRSIQAGASGYVLKSELPEDIVNTIIKLVNGSTYLSAHATDVLIEQFQQNQSQQPLQHKVAQPVAAPHVSLLSKSELEALAAVGHVAENSYVDEETPGHGSPLTNKETQVLRHVQSGYPAKKISTLLDISVFTVNQHLRSIYRKLDVHNKMAAVARANDQGLL
jgi:DNA-binding NarL/FixJ family response regulator